ncbi:hypothetical protein H2198_000333 [Neophaeococcomyces mojaviensis]|uniref:Uncharacterized protein n=1 Tax=Neophaeococcomyces mojaviensis TaxID=3383035 RepID=A0ACC3AKF9_9EURO|nr:hypothetical protein H2198_000333 [Knufia sp. JES_112]
MFFSLSQHSAGVHDSLFHYNVTRPYPYRWFTPVVIFAFIIATVLFSLLNFVSNGYNLTVETTNDPNTTLTASTWISKWPSALTSRLQATCQATEVPLQSQLFTNQSALTYSLTGVRAGYEDDDVVSSLWYLNNPIEECTISAVTISMEAIDAQANQFAFAEWNLDVKVYASCTITRPDGVNNFNLTASYNYVPVDVDMSTGLASPFLGSVFRSRNKEKRASLWWGESCMSMYWAYLSRTMQDIRASMSGSDIYAIRKGFITFRTRNPPPSDITSLDFWDADYRFIVDLGAGRFNVITWPTMNTAGQRIAPVASLVDSETYPNVWLMADTLAKTSASTVLTDLGQTSPAFPNILADTHLLEYFTANFSTAIQHIANAHPGPETSNYSAAKGTTGPLGVTPSVFSRTYICQVPKVKSTGNLIVSILIADLVFLQALWNIFKLVVDAWVLPRNPDTNVCQGCLAKGSRGSQANFVDEDFDAVGETGVPLTRIKPSKKAGGMHRIPFHRQSSSQYGLLEQVS